MNVGDLLMIRPDSAGTLSAAHKPMPVGADAMTTRYIALPAPPKQWSNNWDETGYRPSCEVIEADRSPQKTGLLDASGTPLYRVADAVPIGFRGRGERA